MSDLYPLLFEPNLHSVVWGGSRLSPFKGLEASCEPVGESWEVSAVPSSSSVVSNGCWAGRDLISVVGERPVEILGERVAKQYSNRLPLLVKFIDAEKDLSIQVHPDDIIAKKRHGEGQFGKTEMWYVVDAEPGASLYAGLKESITPAQYQSLVASGEICSVLASHEVKTGDVFHIPAGRIHAIGSGILLVEVQQTSDITYRIYDYNRKGLDGKLRELHTEAAAEAIDYHVRSEYRTHYTNRKDAATLVINCPYFTIRKVRSKGRFHRNMKKYDSFVICVCLKGDCQVQIKGEPSMVTLQEGSSVLIPACLADYYILPSNPNGTVQLLEAFIDGRKGFWNTLLRFFHK